MNMQHTCRKYEIAGASLIPDPCWETSPGLVWFSVVSKPRLVIYFVESQYETLANDGLFGDSDKMLNWIIACFPVAVE